MVELTSEAKGLSEGRKQWSEKARGSGFIVGLLGLISEMFVVVFLSPKVILGSLLVIPEVTEFEASSSWLTKGLPDGQKDLLVPL